MNSKDLLTSFHRVSNQLRSYGRLVMKYFFYLVVIFSSLPKFANSEVLDLGDTRLGKKDQPSAMLFVSRTPAEMIAAKYVEPKDFYVKIKDFTQSELFSLKALSDFEK